MDTQKFNERRRDYQEFIDDREKLGFLIKENQVLNARIEHLEQTANDFEKLKNDLVWVLRISKIIVAVLMFLTGDEIKRRLGL
jgi:hypothetical protein